MGWTHRSVALVILAGCAGSRSPALVATPASAPEPSSPLVAKNTTCPEADDACKAARACDRALADASASVAELRNVCATSAADMKSDEGVRRAGRFVDRVCTPTSEAAEAPACWVAFDARSPLYRPAFAKDVLSRFDCDGSKPCPMGALLDRDAPHYDAARADKLLARIDDACAKRDKACFALGVAGWRVIDSARRMRIGRAAIAECEDKGAKVASTACNLALDATQRGGVVENLEKAASIAARACNDNEHICVTAAACTESGTCAKAPDPVAARGYYERACAMLTKIDPKRPRADLTPCREADRLR
jgi:hypothetical protein